MKKTLILTLLALLGLTQAMAQEYEYIPFVREGVKWVYCIYNDGDFFDPDPHFPIGWTYQTLEFKGDTVINGRTYKAMHKYSGKAIDQENDTIPVYLREENKVVYGIVPDGKFYRDCPIALWADEEFYNLKLSGEEFILYDFNDPVSFLDGVLDEEHTTEPFAYLNTELIAIGNHLAKRHEFQYETNFYLVEGIGYDGLSSYTLMLWFTPYVTGTLRYQEAEFYLSHVVEDGKIIYKGIGYEEPEPFFGDYNGDGVVNVSDVTTLINILLTGRAGDTFNDMNGDGVLNISDVTTLINYLLTHI